MKKKLILAIFLVVFVDMLGLAMLIPFVPIIFSIKKGLLLNVPEFYKNLILGLFLASYPFFQFLAAPILGALSDKHGRKKIMLISLFGSFIGYLLFPLGLFLSSVLLLFLSRIIDGFTGANVSVAMAMLSDISKSSKERAKNLALIGAAFGLGFIFGPAIAYFISKMLSLEAVFIFSALLTFFNFVFVIFLPETNKNFKDKKVSYKTFFKAMRKAFVLKTIKYLALSYFLVYFAWAFFQNFFQVFLYAKGFSEKIIALYLAYVGIWIVISQAFLVRKILSKYYAKKVLDISLFFVALFLLFLTLFYNNLLFILPFLAFSFAFTQPSFSSLFVDRYGKGNEGEALGLRQSIFSFSQIFPPFLGALFLSISPAFPLLLASALVFFAWIIFLSKV